jgi:phosphatidate cytidylyltransferase
MSEIVTRSLTGAVLVAVVIGATLYSLSSSIALWTILTVLGVRELRSNALGNNLGVLYLSAAAMSVVGLGFFSLENGLFYIDLENYHGINGVAFLCVVWANDTFAYLGGLALGKKIIAKGLAPSVSPNKSWEGAVVGALVASLVAYLFIGLAGILIGLCVGILATFSDLIESKAKRKAGIKDTGSLLPGHGGVLDRFDALLISAPFTFIVIYTISQ